MDIKGVDLYEATSTYVSKAINEILSYGDQWYSNESYDIDNLLYNH